MKALIGARSEADVTLKVAQHHSMVLIISEEGRVLDHHLTFWRMMGVELEGLEGRNLGRAIFSGREGISIVNLHGGNGEVVVADESSSGRVK